MITFEELKEKCTCWKGYKRKPGTKPCEEGSCVKEEAEKHHVLAFGRMNPITTGHEAVVNKIHSTAKEHNADHTLVVSHSQDAKKNPLSAEQKVKHAKHAFPGTHVKAASKEHPTILHHASELHKKGVTHLHVVAGSDRHEEMHNLLHKYNGKDAGHGHYNFKKITVHSSGERDPDAEGTTGISASKMREHAASGNKKEFHKGAPSKMKPEHKDAMYNDVRKGMGLHEETTSIPPKKVQDNTFKAMVKNMTKRNGPQKDTEKATDDKEKKAMEQVDEVLRPDMGAGAYINDFIKSTNPRFNNKTKEERRKMAIGAYMAAKAKMNEESVDEQAPVAPVPDRKYIKGTPEWKAHKEAQKPRTGHPTVKEEADQIDEVSDTTKVNYIKAARKSVKELDDAGKEQKRDNRSVNANKVYGGMSDAAKKMANEEVEELDEKSQQARRNKTYKNLMAASKGARVNRELGMTPADTGHKNNQQMNKAIGRAVSRGEVYEGKGDTLPERQADEKEMEKKTEGNEKKVKGFKFFYGKNEPNTQMPVKEGTEQPNGTDAIPTMTAAPGTKIQKIEKKTALIKTHPLAIGSDTEEGWAKAKIKEQTEEQAADREEQLKKFKKAAEGSKLTKEGTMKTFKDFVQDIQEKLIGKQYKLDKNHNGKLDKQDFEMLRKEENDLLEYNADENGVYRHTKKATYGTSYVDPEGADETASDLKKKEKKSAGRKVGQRTGSYKPRATMSKLKQAGATYK